MHSTPVVAHNLSLGMRLELKPTPVRSGGSAPSSALPVVVFTVVL